MIDVSELSYSERKSWFEHPCTQYLLEQLKENKQKQVEGWVNGDFTRETIEASMMKNVQAMSYTQVIDEFINAIEDIVQGDTDYA